jgi:hypothetical protein
MAAAEHSGIPSPSQEPSGAGAQDPAGHPHNFEVQKEIHRRIRNDPDYDDWEYGTEPLPHEAWVEQAAEQAAERAAEQAAAASGDRAAGT